MCGMCGVFLSQAHWTDALWGSGPEAARRRRLERQRAVSLANRVLRHFDLRLSDWNASTYQLATRTGQTLLLPSLAALWPEAERLRRRPIDPLDEALLQALTEAS